MAHSTAGRSARSRESSLIELDEDLPFQRRNWIGQRIGWIAMAAIIAAALTGVFGARGPLSHATAGTAAVLEVEYPRFARHRAPEELKIRAGERALGGGELHLAVSRDYLRGFDIEHITPEPQRVTGRAEALVFVFSLAPAARELEVRFALRPGPAGLHSGVLGTGSGHTARVSTFTWP